ncbi:hypothetical protein [Streptomyces sp. UNOC14_S4]|uniref:hypothetical protein n=1 Tax=Streptomyces sp. UNOC14_S4 TaxID=2872340 RepID=UPI001E32A57D|nr:hypothetical protein [Streptomyces sp. UNOC14_S4]MCC3770977.1 hypothetical protein [Streptomyces sp. UNOC14_S4]
MAAPGYGKRSAPDQKPKAEGDFAHLPARVAHIAAYIDRLPDGAAVDGKTLAKEIALYGQMAVLSALRLLEKAGHLFRFRDRVGENGTQWAWRTYFSRTAREESWWQRLRRGDAPKEQTPEPAPASEPAPEPLEAEALEAEPAAAEVPVKTPRARAYAVLAQVGLVDPRLPLSASECAQLAPLAAEWLVRGVTDAQLMSGLTAGLPPDVHSPEAFTRKRLIAKLPPEREHVAPAPDAGAARPRLQECRECRVPGRPENLPGGLCKDCRGGEGGEVPVGEVAAVHELCADIRAEMRSMRGGRNPNRRI